MGIGGTIERKEKEMTYIVILSYAKDLNTQTNTFQILHFVQTSC